MPNLLKELEITEISLVDVPANEGAKVILFKRDTKPTRRDKMATWLDKIKETLKFSDEEVEEMKKDLATDNSEEITALKAELEEAKKTDGEKVTKLEAKIEELEKATKPDEKPEDIFKGQPELQKRFEDMEKSLKAAQEATEKADKRATDNEDKFNKSEDARKLAEFTKTAEEDYPNTPGEAVVKGRILKAISENLSEEDAKELTQMLASGEEGVSKSLITLGSDGVTTGGGLDKITEAAKEIVAKDNSISMTKAMVMAEDRNPVWAAEYKAEIQ